MASTIDAFSVLRHAFVEHPETAMDLAGRFGEDSYTEASVAAHEASRTLRCFKEQLLRQFTASVYMNSKFLVALRESAKQVGASLQALAELCEVAARSSDVAVLTAALAEARRGFNVAATLPEHFVPSLRHYLRFDPAVCVPLFELVEMDDTGAGNAWQFDASSNFFPRGKHSFTLRVTPPNFNTGTADAADMTDIVITDTDSTDTDTDTADTDTTDTGTDTAGTAGTADTADTDAASTASTASSRLMARFLLQPGNVSVNFTGDPSATWTCTMANANRGKGLDKSPVEAQGSGRLVVSYDVARLPPVVFMSVHVLGVCVRDTVLVSWGLYVSWGCFGWHIYSFISSPNHTLTYPCMHLLVQSPLAH